MKYHFAFIVHSSTFTRTLKGVGFNLDQEDILSAYNQIFREKMALQAAHPDALFEIDAMGFDFRSLQEMDEDKAEIERLLGVEHIWFH